MKLGAGAAVTVNDVVRCEKNAAVEETRSPEPMKTVRSDRANCAINSDANSRDQFTFANSTRDRRAARSRRDATDNGGVARAVTRLREPS